MQLYDHSLAQVKKCGLPYFLFTEQKQVGESFGERLAHAFELTFKKGFDAVIAVGSDCPMLSGNHLKKAAESLVSNEAVAGATSLGGSYLFGLRKSSFDYNKVSAQLAWQTSELFTNLLEAFPLLIKLEVLAEINEEKHFSLYFYYRKTISRCFEQLFTLIYSWYSTKVVRPAITILLPAFVFESLPARAP